MHACESEDLPTVPGAPRLAAHRLVEWASGRNGCSVRVRCAGSVVRPSAVTTPSIEGPRTTVTAIPFTATVTGSPRIGPKRELKRATESYWKGNTSRSELEKVAATLRHDTWAQLAAAGLDSVPVNTFSYYDQVLDTAVLLGALPERVQAVSDDLDRYFAAARGTGDIAPLEMTKWFDTNYHYIVPEIGPKTKFSLHPEKVLSELKEAQDQGITARPVVIGPVTFLLLSKAVDGAGAPIERLDELVPLYSDLLGQLADEGAEWVQIDEPVLVTDISADAPALAEKVYNTLGALEKRPAIHVATYFGDPGKGLAALARTPVEAIGVDFVYGADTAVANISGAPGLADKTLVAGIVDGRNIWRTDLESALGKLASLLGPVGLGGGINVVLDAARAVLAGARDRPGRRAAQLAGVRRREGARGRHAGQGAEGRPRRGGRRDRAIQRSRRLAQEGPAAEQQQGARAPRVDREVRWHASVVRPPSAGKRRTTACTCRRCRRPPSGRSRRPSRSERPAPRWSPVRSTRPSTRPDAPKRSPT